MKLRSLHLLGLVSIAACQGDFCPEDPCESSFNLLRWCATSKMCRVNGQLVTTCPNCALSDVAPGDRIEIPFDAAGPVLGKRNDLVIRWDRDVKDESNVQVFLDGVPATEEQCKREPFANLFKVICLNLSGSLKRLEFEYIPPMSGGGSISVELYMHDKECEDTHEVCPV